jgi:hypothetical protein
MTRTTRPARRIFAVFTIASALALTGCAPANNQPGGAMTTNDASNPYGGTRPAKEVFSDFLDTIDDAVQHSGTTFPKWDRHDVAGYTGAACGAASREDGHRYRTQLEGGPVADPKAAVETMKSHWEAKGYTIGDIIDESDTTAGKGIELNATTPSGVIAQFTASTLGSFVNVQSDCTLDPLAKETTTETIPLSGTGTATSSGAFGA